MASEENIENASKSFFKGVDWLAFWLSGIVALIVYTYTLAPSVTLEDGGELAVAGDWLGVPHPPGYPSWTMLAWLFARIFSFVTFRGQPNPSWGIAFLSAFFGALSAGLAALLVCRSGRDLLRLSTSVSLGISKRMENLICLVAGFSSSLLFAFTPIMWSQSVIVEVYSLNAFFLILVMLLVYMWLCRPKDHYLYWAALVFGIGLTNYQVLLLAALALAIVVMFKDFELFRDFFIVGTPIVASIAFVALVYGAKELPNVTHPTAANWYWFFGLNGALLILAYYFLPRGKTVAITILLAQAGVAVYAFMPVVSDLRNPPMNWGYPKTFEGFLHAISRGQYEQITPADLFSMRYVRQIGTYLADLRLNYTMFITLVAFLPFCAWKWANREGKPVFDAMKWGILLTFATLLLLPIGTVRLTSNLNFSLYKVPALGVMLLLMVGALMTVVARFRGLLQDHMSRSDARLWERIMSLIVMILLAAAYLFLVLRKFSSVMDPIMKGKAIPDGFAGEIFLILLLLVMPGVIIFVAYKLVCREEHFILTVDPGVQRWMVSTLFAFVTLSLGLIALANLKMDIQDTFIQRVKFISSHLFFAFWIGYGLIFLLAYLDSKLKDFLGSLSDVTVLCAALLPLIPILANSYNTHLINVYGGADQHDRDFGWQFGNYSLRGSNAILEELSPDEEPLPNPAYPPTMGDNAVFFGGTDPGRFVPTYMIYSADVRPDVYLITQNALADGTYMSVMRDLYGNDIWIPSVKDSAAAFGEFVQEIESGKRPPMPGVTIQNGRVQVSGVMGVMEINAILARMIYEHNHARHDFYIEESYVIRWMYPYLSPHGLIMKINHESLPRLPQSVIEDDLDFWDWYTRRFLLHPMFRRDVVAQKSFSKLRSAIAGLYMYRGLLREAEIAFREALALYPLSPEAHFRLAEMYLRSMRFEDARELIQSFKDKDPANDRVDGFLQQVRGAEKVHKRIGDLEKQLREGQLTGPSAMELANLYQRRGQTDRFRSIADNLVGNPQAPASMLIPLGRMFQQAGMPDRASDAITKALDRLPPDVPTQFLKEAVDVYRAVQNQDGLRKVLPMYLDRQPNAWKQWLELATLRLAQNDTDSASKALNSALRFGGTEARITIQRHPVLSRIMQEQDNRKRGVLGLGL
jgi:tetratricopeptide (TPR) repeat protein/uncharacterized membrane-anchored protein YitT (DUF2179 family)